MVRIGVLTSSRADFGVYLPLLKRFKTDQDIDFKIIAFGAHLSNLHGRSIDEIFQQSFQADYQISTMLSDDSEAAISTSASLTSLKFSDFWANHKDDFDIVLCLGDRFEMFSAVIAAVPFGIKFAHFYGGDFSKGAIDNVYRNGLTHASVIHFTSNKKCTNKVKTMADNPFSIDEIGILSLEETENTKLLTIEAFKNRWNIDLLKPTILITFHPETVSPEKNNHFAKILFETFSIVQKTFQLVFTMPNADTNGNIYRKTFFRLKDTFPNNIFLVENFGIQSYFTCMKNSLLMVGNTSSGISEAASFQKFFINVGERQIGREFGPNIISVGFVQKKLIKSINDTIKLGAFKGKNIYRNEGALALVVKRLKDFSSRKDY